MLQLQYLNNKLKKSQLDHILSNYNIKYNTMKREIESKLNILIKTFLEDIDSFLEKMEEIAIEKQKLKEFDRDQNTVQFLREELSEKNHMQTKLKHQIDLLLMENKRMKILLKESSPSPSPRRNKAKIDTKSFTKKNKNTSITPEAGKKTKSYIEHPAKKLSANDIINEINNIDNDEDIISSNNDNKVFQTVINEGKSRRVIASVLKDKNPVKLSQKEHKRIYCSTDNIKSDNLQKNNNNYNNNEAIFMTPRCKNIKETKNNYLSSKNNINNNNLNQKNLFSKTKTPLMIGNLNKKTNNKVNDISDKNKNKIQNNLFKKQAKTKGLMTPILKNKNNSKNPSIYSSNTHKKTEPKIIKKNSVRFKELPKKEDIKIETNNIENENLDFLKTDEIINIGDYNLQSEDDEETKDILQKMKESVVVEEKEKEEKEEKEEKNSKELSPLKEMDGYENDDKFDDDIVDQEIDEMSSYEKQIISLMGEIQEFQKLNEK